MIYIFINKSSQQKVSDVILHFASELDITYWKFDNKKILCCKFLLFCSANYLPHRLDITYWKFDNTKISLIHPLLNI